MTAANGVDDLVASLAVRGIQLWCEGDRLRFRAPKGVLEPWERALFADRRAEVIAGLRDAAAARAEEMPLSPQQFMMWFQHDQSPSSALCTIGWAWRVRGSLNLAALRHAVQALVDRHAVLRTTYHLREQSLIQRIAGAARAALEVHPLAELEQLATHTSRPFDLETGPVMRTVLFTDAALEHLLLATFHHIAVDAWSTDLLRNELLTLYTEFVDERPPRLERPLASYADFVRWQAAAMGGASGERQSAYWLKVLAAPRQQSVFPPQLATPSAPRFAGASIQFDLDAALVIAIRELAARLRTTPFVVQLGTFQLLVAKLCGIRDVVTGTPALGRPTSEYHSVVGNFINVLPVRSRFEPGTTVTVFLAQLHDSVVGALEEQHYPLSRIVQELHVDRDGSGQTLFNTSFTMLKSDEVTMPPNGALPEAVFTWHPLVFQAGLLDLSLDILANDSAFHCVLKHSLAALSIDAAQHVSREYVRLLGAIIAAPGEVLDAFLGETGDDMPDAVRTSAAQLLASLRSMGAELSVENDKLTVNASAAALTPAVRARIAEHKSALIGLLRESVGRLPLMTPEERQQVTAEFHATQVTLDSAPMIVQFERQVVRTPNAIALRCAGVALSYDTLNRRANRIARHLRHHGAGRGKRVGLCLNRSMDLLSALLAVAKSGAAYVPLDPGFPAARLADMIGHSDLTLLVVDAERDFGIAAETRIIDLTADAAVIASLPDTNLDVIPEASDPAYIIYTSGSTGRPNGVVVSHAALANFLGAMRREPGMSPTDVLAAVTTVSFDIAGLEMYLPLLVGACIVMVPKTVAADGEALSALLVAEQVTVMQATPATWRLLLEAGWQRAPHFVACCGGDVLMPELARSLLERVDVLWNLYGPTETTIWSTLGRVEPGPAPVTIGRPIANTQIYILDSAGNPTPIGVPGEIWIGGAGVASGYWRNPELTAKKFLPDPFADQERRGLIYRTGDRGRWLADGRIVHMGRLDQQLKLRGFRIEPAEIENALALHPAIREAAVVMRGDSPERERLVAYVVYRRGSTLTTSEVREHLRNSLPDYMMPAMFMPLDALPLTPNGKIDRRALPDPLRQGGLAASDYIAPATEAERVIASIWQDALAIERVGAEDNFFDLGGHSLLGLHVAAKIHKRTGWRMPSYLMFRQTLRQIAASLSDYQAGRGAAE